MLKDVAREVYSQTNLDSGTDIESLSNLNHCRDTLTQVLNGNGSEIIPKKADKVSKAQDIVGQATKLMGENVKKMIDN